MFSDGSIHQLPDVDPQETAEWLDSLDAVIDAKGTTRARYLMSKLTEHARERQVGTPAEVSTPYVNTIPTAEQPWFPGDEYIEKRIRAYIRWNAAVMVVYAKCFLFASCTSQIDESALANPLVSRLASSGVATPETSVS